MRRAWLALVLSTAIVTWGSAFHGWPIGLTEILGFATGAACVLLVVQENIWNFPVGLANNVFFLVLFLEKRLYGDMVLQIVYLALGAAGWWAWARGGPDRAPLAIRRASAREQSVLLLGGAVATFVLTRYLRSIGDAAPFPDAATTVLSLIAQWLLNRKRLENWYVWIAADVLYVYLYVDRGLFLTAVLYATFIAMCVAGLRRWRRAVVPARVSAAA